MLTQPFDKLLKLGDLLLMVAFLARVFSAVGLLPHLVRERSYNIYQLIISIDVIILSLRTVSFRSTKHDFGLLVIMVEQMVGDLILFIELFLLVSVGFMLAFVGLTPTRSGEEEEGLVGGFAGDGMGRLLGGDGEHDHGVGRLLKGSLQHADGAGGDDEASVVRSLTVMFWGIFGEFDLLYYEKHVYFG